MGEITVGGGMMELESEGRKAMDRLTVPDVRVDEHTIRRAFVDAEAVRDRAMEVYWRLKAYEDTERSPDEILPKEKADEIALSLMRLADLESFAPYDRLRELAEADKDGRLVVLPCQSGEHVFALLDDKKYVRECEVKHAVLNGWRKVFFIAPVGDPQNGYVEDLEKARWYLDREIRRRKADGAK